MAGSMAMNLSALHPNGRPAGNRRLTCFAACALLLYAGSGLAQLEPAPEGRVRFYNIADTDFDRYSKRPSEGDQAWMRANFSRMQTYSPYFDRRTAWFPNAWVYKDSYAIKPHWPEYREHPDWILRDADGDKLFIPWGCKKGTCPQYAGDVGNPAFRAHWIAAAREKLAQGYRGIWVDDVNLTWRVSDGNGEHVRPIDPRTGEPMVLADWRRYFAEFMEELRAALPDVELAHNAIWYAGPFDDPFIRRQIDAADFINLERGASDGGLKRGDGKFGFERFLAFLLSRDGGGGAGPLEAPAPPPPDRSRGGGITAHVVEPSRAARLAPWPEAIDPRVRRAYARRRLRCKPLLRCVAQLFLLLLNQLLTGLFRTFL